MPECETARRSDSTSRGGIYWFLRCSSKGPAGLGLGVRLNVPMWTSCELQSVIVIAKLDISSLDHTEPRKVRIADHSGSLRVMEVVLLRTESW